MARQTTGADRPVILTVWKRSGRGLGAGPLDLLAIHKREATACEVLRPKDRGDLYERHSGRAAGDRRLPWPPEMQLLARRVRQRQDAATELYDLLEESPPWREAAHRFEAADRAVLPRVAREVLGVSREEQGDWTDRSEPAGIRAASCLDRRCRGTRCTCDARRFHACRVDAGLRLDASHSARGCCQQHGRSTSPGVQHRA